MFQFRTLALFSAAVALLASMALVPMTRAEPTTAPAATGTLKGTVVDADGKAVAGATVSVYAVVEKKPEAKEGKGNHQSLVPAVTSDTDGSYTITDVPAGKVWVGAMLKGTGHGKSKALTLDAGATVTVPPITLKGKPRPAA
jgi:uncharacterized GH25 family protein